MRRGIAIVAVLSGVMLNVVVVAPAAKAACTETGIFLNKPNYDAYATVGALYTYKDSLGSCGGPVVQTQLIILSSDGTDWAEVGYERVYTGIIGGTKERVFGEWGIFPGGSHKKIYINLSSGKNARFKVWNSPGTFDWYIYVDPNGGTTFTYLDRYCCLYNSHGWAMGEVSKYGGSDTDAYNHEWSLQYKDSSNTYHSYGDARRVHRRLDSLNPTA